MTNNNLQEASERLPLVKLEKAIKQNMIHPTHLFPDFSYFCRTGKPQKILKFMFNYISVLILTQVQFPSTI